MAGMMVYVAGQLVGETKVDAPTVRKANKNTTGVYGRGGCLSAKGVSAMDCDSAEISEKIFSCWGRVATSQPKAVEKQFVCHYCGCAATGFGFFDVPTCDECR